MPYKSEQIKIEFSQFDKRIKLTDEQKEKIREEYATGLISQRNLAKKYKVNRKTIFNIIHPKKYQAQLEKYKLNQHSKQYYQKEKHKEYIKKHRRYKQELYINGEIINE
jgi:DNA-binding XRE family transcriptional regulator